MADTKRCVDCKHCVWPACASGATVALALMAECRNPKLLEPDAVGCVNWHKSSRFVDGEGYALAAGVRNVRSGPLCGEDAIWFEPVGRDRGA